jgi:flavin reductase (DIM6/NTAB) family NADH-FMN oxidoreductase RutF
MTASWAGICCGKPPAVAVSLRKATYSYQSIVDSKAFTVNVPPAKHAKIADYIGIASGRNVDKFAAAGLTPVKSEAVNAPYVLEFPLVLECALIHTIEIGLHTQFIGEIMDVKADAAVLSEDGKADPEKIDTFFFSATNRVYYGTGPIVGKAFSIGKDLPGESRQEPW